MAKSSKPPRREFERRFLVRVDRLPKLPKPVRIVQGYLRVEPLQERVRLFGGKRAEFQIKGPDDLETAPMAMDLGDATYLLERFRVPGSLLVAKDRHVLAAGFGGLIWEIDRFFEENLGLVIAELETPKKRFAIPAKKRPDWLGREVTNDPRFKNKALTFHPFLSWPEEERREVVEHAES